jgi:selT/selW/selH-like putative selenoprotein
LQRSGGGAFEIRIDGRIAFSKKALGRFPEDAEIVGIVT